MDFITTIPLVQENKIRALAVTSSQRVTRIAGRAYGGRTRYSGFRRRLRGTQILTPTRAPPTSCGRVNTVVNDWLKSPPAEALAKFVMQERGRNTGRREGHISSELAKWGR